MVLLLINVVIINIYDEQLKKWVKVCLLDEELELPKYKRTCQDIKNNVIEHFADGKRYVDILHTMKQTKFSTTSISRLFQEYQVNKLNVPKIKLEPNQFIYISIDDGHRKFWKFKRNSGKYSMRLVLFCTDNVNHKLVNKRADVIIRPTKTTDIICYLLALNIYPKFQPNKNYYLWW